MVLETNFLEIGLDNPFILASAPPTKDKESIINGYKAGWGGAITKSVSIEQLKDKTPRICHLKYKNKVIGSQNYEMGSVYSVEQWVEWVHEIKEEYPNRLLGVSLFGSPDKKEWRELSLAFKNTPADLYELNFSCPHADHEGKGSVIGQKPDLCALLTRTVKDVVGDEKKILVKHTYLSHPNEGYISKKCVEAGADGFAAINTIAGLSPINIYTYKPKLNTGGKTTHGGISGSIIRPFSRASIANVAGSINYEKYHISAMGGVTSEIESIVEYLLLGAKTLQACTEVMNKGYNIINEMKKNLKNYLKNTGLTLDQLIGKSVSSVSDWFSLDEISRTAKITDTCNECYTCIPYCNYDAIIKEEDKIIINEENCDGCGSCASICPSEAIEMTEKNTYS